MKRTDRWFVMTMECYYAARQAQELRAEAYSAGHATELADFYETVEPKLTFHRFLCGMRGRQADLEER